jgi:hypothetical protein
MRFLTKYLSVALLTCTVGVSAAALFSAGSESATSYSSCNGPETGYIPSSLNPNERYEIVPATATEKAHWIKFCSGIQIPFHASCPYPGKASGPAQAPK